MPTELSTLPDVQTTEFAIPGDVRVTVPANPSLMTPFVLDEQGDWFEGEIQFVRRFMTPGMSVVDVGANYGLYALTSARRVGAEGRVWAYEPASLPRGCLAQSLVANGFHQVRVVGKALSDHSGCARLGICANSELNSLSDAGQAGETVPLATLDEEAMGWDRPIDFLKLDAEGEEIRILQGAKRFLADQDPLVMFEHKHGAVVNHGLTEAFSELGMSLYRHLPGLNVLVPLETVGDADPYLLNIFACHRKRARRLEEQGLLMPSPAPLDASMAKADAEGAVLDWVRSRPWSSLLFPSGPLASDIPGNELVTIALVDLIEADNERRSADERWARQKRGFALLKQALCEYENVARLLSTSRVAMDLGERLASVALLERAGRLLARSGFDPAVHLEEMFLPPHHRHDDLDAGAAAPAAVVQVMVDEPFLERVAFSIYFAADGLAPLLRRIGANPLRSEAMKRRPAATTRVIRLS